MSPAESPDYPIPLLIANSDHWLRIVIRMQTPSSDSHTLTTGGYSPERRLVSADIQLTVTGLRESLRDTRLRGLGIGLDLPR